MRDTFLYAIPVLVVRALTAALDWAGLSCAPPDVLAAVRYVHENGAKAVSVVGASMGGNAAEGQLAESEPVKRSGRAAGTRGVRLARKTERAQVAHRERR